MKPESLSIIGFFVFLDCFDCFELVDTVDIIDPIVVVGSRNKLTELGRVTFYSG
jgi:hypothetical protein